MDSLPERSRLQKELADKDQAVEDLKAELAAAKQRNADLDRGLNSNIRDRHDEKEELRVVVHRAAEAIRRLGLDPAEWNQDPPTAKVRDYAQFFDSLAGQLAGLKESLDETLEQEGKQIGTFIATRLLSRLHHRDPNFPVEAVHEKIVPATARKEAEAAVAPHVAKIVGKLERHG
jgi:septal ring factor EnvC (AmiA/AmiB activator)